MTETFLLVWHLPSRTVKVSIYQRGDWNFGKCFKKRIWCLLKWVATKEVTETNLAAVGHILAIVKVSIYGHAQCKEVTKQYWEWDQSFEDSLRGEVHVEKPDLLTACPWHWSRMSIYRRDFAIRGHSVGCVTETNFYSWDVTMLQVEVEWASTGTPSAKSWPGREGWNAHCI